MYKRNNFYLFLFAIVSIFGACNKEHQKEAQGYIHECRLLNSGNFFFNENRIFNVTYNYSYDESNILIKRTDNITEMLDSIVYDDMGRVREQHSIGLNNQNVHNIRTYFFHNDELNPISSEYIGRDLRGELNLREEYVYNKSWLSELTVLENGKIIEKEEFDYDEVGNLLEHNKTIYLDTYTYSIVKSYNDYDNMKNPFRDFPFRDNFGLRNSLNNFQSSQIIEGTIDSLGEFIGIPYIEIFGMTISYNEFGYPFFLEYDCN